MNPKGKIFAVLIALIFTALFTGSIDLAAESAMRPDNKPVAEEMLDSSGISWSPKIGYARLILTVAVPDGSVFHRTFEPGASPYFNLSDLDAQSLLDGLYTYELLVVPVIRSRVADDTGTDSRQSDQERITQTGYFTVRGGAIINNTSSETVSRPFDQLILDDLIVTGSLCVGFDCYNGESFGFDTLRLKENNLRIHFQDTSTSAEFPTNDWRITVNDSTNGGASYFSIDDVDSGKSVFKIEAGSRAKALYVDDSGRIGFGTSTPSEDLHIAYGDTPTVRLDQDGSSGWAPQKWDVAGNEANFFIRDVTNGSKLPLRIQPSTPGDTLCLKADGKVGIGTWSPEAQFEVETTSQNALVLIQRSDGATAKIASRPDEVFFGSHSNHDVKIVADNNEIITVKPGGHVGIGVDLNPTHLLHLSGGAYSDGTTWETGSSIALKENIQSLDAVEAIAAVETLKPVKFNYKTNKLEENVGFIAEEVPELVATNGRKSLSAMDIVAVLTRVVQEQQKTISNLNNRIEDLENRLKGK
jgi:hypothetical protein